MMHLEAIHAPPPPPEEGRARKEDHPQSYPHCQHITEMGAAVDMPLNDNGRLSSFNLFFFDSFLKNKTQVQEAFFLLITGTKHGFTGQTTSRWTV